MRLSSPGAQRDAQGMAEPYRPRDRPSAEPGRGSMTAAPTPHPALPEGGSTPPAAAGARGGVAA